MLGYFILLCCSVGPAELVRPSRQGYKAGVSPLRASLEVHGISRHPNGYPSQEAETVQEELQARGPSPIASSPEAREDPDMDKPNQRRGNWCSVVDSRIVTFIASCKTEKYVIKSQQPCPYGSPECQKVMYRVAVKPVYQVKQKVLTSVKWKCCPGYWGSDCQQNDPNAILIPPSHITGIKGETESPFPEEGTAPTAEPVKFIRTIQDQESTLEALQNDVHQATSSLRDLQSLLEFNLTTSHDINQTSTEFEEQLLQQVLLPYVEKFLREHFNPVLTSFNKSLQLLSNKMQNLSENVEFNQKNIEKFHFNTAAKKDLQELGTKFESKIQENVDQLDQLKRDMDNNYHVQQASLNYNLTMMKAETDFKVKRNLKIQQTQISVLNNSIDEVRRGQEILQDEIQTLNRNITALWINCGTKEVRSTPDMIRELNKSLGEHLRHIKDLELESDAAFENINTLEKWVKDLRTQFRNTASELQVSLIEKGLIMEENKVALQRQIMELNYTIINLQESNDDLLSYIKNCDCQRLTADLETLEEDQRNLSSIHKDVFQTLTELRRKESNSQNSLQNSIEDLSMALHPIQQSLVSQQEQNRNIMQSVTQLSSKAKDILDDVNLLKKTDEAVHGHIKNLDSSFSSLLEDAMRHDRALEALLGEEIMEVLSEEQPEALKMSIFQVYEVINTTSKMLEKQQASIESMKKRIELLETQNEAHSDSPESHRLSDAGKPTESTADKLNNKRTTVEHMEPNHEAARDDQLDNPSYNDIMSIKKEVRHLGTELKKLEAHWTKSSFGLNESVSHLAGSLNSSIDMLKLDMASLKQHFRGHVNLFEKLFKNAHEWAASNRSVDVAKIHSAMAKKTRKQHIIEEKQDKRDSQQTKAQTQTIDDFTENILDVKLHEKVSSVAFYAGFSEGDNETGVLHFNELYLNYGNAYLLEEGYFKAPQQGVYLFIISVEFGPGPAMGQLVFGSRSNIPLHKGRGKESDESPTTSFAIVELKKGEMVWFELVQGSVVKRSPPGTLIGGYLIFKT
ncbi:multimerin-2 [Lissotriton helveticus]